MIPKRRPDVRARLREGPLDGVILTVPAGTGRISRGYEEDGKAFLVHYVIRTTRDDLFHFEYQEPIER